MKGINRLSNERANELLLMKKTFKKNTGRPLRLSINSELREDIPLVSEDGQEEFLLCIHRSQKRIAKVTFHHLEKTYNSCLFRLDFNGTPHTNPKEPNEFVPESMKKFAGNKLNGSHVHYYVEGYGPELSWAIPLKETKFSMFDGNKEIESILQQMVDLVCTVINLSDKIVYDQNLNLTYGE